MQTAILKLQQAQDALSQMKLDSKLAKSIQNAENQLVQMALDPYGLGKYSDVINPATGQPYTFVEGQLIVDRILGQESGLTAPSPPPGSIQLDIEIPERLIISASENIEVQVSALSSSIEITGGFMEDHVSHSYKPDTPFISGDSPDTIQIKPAGRFNYGIDYVVNASPPITESWFTGTVTDIIPNTGRGYGNRVIIETDQIYTLNGVDYTIYTGYAHLDSFEPNLTEGQNISAGESVGIMGNTGGSHGAHVDLKIWINVNGQQVNISPNAINMAAPVT